MRETAVKRISLFLTILMLYEVYTLSCVDSIGLILFDLG